MVYTKVAIVAVLALMVLALEGMATGGVEGLQQVSAAEARAIFGGDDCQGAMGPWESEGMNGCGGTAVKWSTPLGDITVSCSKKETFGSKSLLAGLLVNDGGKCSAGCNKTCGSYVSCSKDCKFGE